MNDKKVPASILVGQGVPFEKQSVGEKFHTQGRTITEADLANFIGVTGMFEALFTNLEYVQNESVIKGRAVPAALAYGFAEGQLLQGMLQGVGMAFLGMELDVKAPVCVGDTIHVEAEVIESRPSTSRPGVGLVRTRNCIVNQRGDTVIVYTPLRMIKGNSLDD